MRCDASLAFVPIGSPLSLVGGLGVAFVSPNIIDLLGQGVGTPPANIFGTPTVYGAADGMGVGKTRVEMAVATGAAFVTADSATLNIQLQGAIDSGVSGGYQPGTWNTFVETGAMAAGTTANNSALPANYVVMRFPWLPPFPSSLRPRFLRLNFVIPASTQFTAGTIAYAIPTEGRDDYSAQYSAKNYVVA